jgi:hypothetical protein
LEFNGWSEVDMTVELAPRPDGIGGRVIGRRSTSEGVDVDALMRATTDNVRALVEQVVLR